MPDTLAEAPAPGVSRLLWGGWLGVMGLLAGAYALGGVAGPEWLHGSLLFNLLGGGAIVALILGAHTNSPKRRLPWYLLAIGQGCFVASDVLASNYERLFGARLPFPSVADSFHLAFYPFLVGGMLLLIHEREETRDRSALIDALIVTMALATLLWVYLISPYADDSSMTLLARMASIGYPAMDILVLGVVARMAAGSHRREPSFIFLLTGAAILLGADTVFGARLLEGRFQPGVATSVGWAAFYVMLAASALHPSMRLLSEPGPESESGLTRARLALLACASLTVPLVIVVRKALGEQIDLYVLVGASAAMFALVLMRMAGIMRRHEEVTRREAALRVELTERAVTERSEERMGSLIKNSSDVVCVVGPDTVVHYVSPSLAQMFAHDPAELAERELTEIIHPDDSARVRGLIAAIAAGPPAQRSVAEFRISHGDGEDWRDVEALGSNLIGDETVEGIVLNIRDVSERKAFEDELEHQAFHDTLTGLPNRALFRNRVEHSLLGRRRDHLPVAVMFADVDDFKFINDSLGHAAGDELLQEIGRRLEDCMRPVDTAARLGGDEFAILIRDSESELHSVEVAQRVMSAVCAPVTLEGREVSVTISVGIAFSDQNMVSTRDAEELLRNADAAMYMAKESGKGGYQLFNPDMHLRAMARLELKTELQRALEQGEFTLRYQPIMDLARGRHGRHGGPGPLGAPREGTLGTDRIRGAARGNGADRRGGAPHPARSLLLGCPHATAVPARAAAVDGRQRLGAPAAAPRVPRRGRRGARADRHRPLEPDTGADRERDDAGHGGQPDAPGVAAPARGETGDRRLRHGLQLAQLRPRAARGHPQDRPLLPRRHQPAGRRDDRLDRRAGPDLQPQSRRRGGREPRAARAPAGDALRLRAGLSLRQAPRGAGDPRAAQRAARRRRLGPARPCAQGARQLCRAAV